MKNTFSKTKLLAMALIIILGLIFFNIQPINKTIKNFFYSISAPFQKIIDKSFRNIKDSWNFLNSLKHISEKNLTLKTQIQELTAQNIELKELEKENEMLRSYLNLPVRQRYQVELANITGRNFQGLENYILIDKGKEYGIEIDMSVIAFKDILVGRIIEVFDNFSKVLLLSSPNSKIPVRIQGSRIEGLVYGLKENLLIIDLIPKDIEVSINQVVITTGINSVFPKGLLIGQISSVKSLENAMFQEIEAMPILDLGKLEQVFIIKR